MERVRQAANLLLQYKIELSLITISIIIGIASIMIYFLSINQTPTTPQIARTTTTHQQKSQSLIVVDIGGSVINPDSYQIPEGSRLKDLLLKAGGMSAEADKIYFGRNFNLSQVLSDQDKVYIPSFFETQYGQFIEYPHQPGVISSRTYADSPLNSAQTVSLNNSSREELEALPNIGAILAQKIIDNRPYRAVDDLLNQKILKQNIYDSIKDSVAL